MLRPPSSLKGFFIALATLIACFNASLDRGLAQAPPLSPPEVGALPTGQGALWLGPWLLTPSLDVSTFYDSNIYSSPTTPVSGPGLHFHPSLLADWNTGIHDTQLYGNIDSSVYPTLDYHNNTFNNQAGFVEKYAPLRDLTFTVQGDYAHNTLASVLTNSIPTPIVSPATPLLPGSAGVVATQQTVVNPNDTYTGTATIYKELNRAYVQLGGSAYRTDYPSTPTQNIQGESYNGSGGIWLTPWFYAYTTGAQAFSQPAVGVSSDSFSARGGIGSAQIGLFQGSVYYGKQGTEVPGDGKAGGDIYGGVVSYFPTDVWNMSLSVDRLRNISDINEGTPLALGGLPLSSVGVPTNASAQITSIAFRSDYRFSEQTSFYGVVSDTRTAYIGISRVDNSWLVSAGIRRQLRDNLSLTLSYQYTRLTSPEPNTSFTRNLISLGAHYNF
jgi:opacity protein-like surface antigen